MGEIGKIVMKAYKSRRRKFINTVYGRSVVRANECNRLLRDSHKGMNTYGQDINRCYDYNGILMELPTK